METWKYVIKGEGRIALAVHSSMQLHELKEYIRLKSKRLHPQGTETVYCWGGLDIVNPQVMLIQDFVDFCPALIGA